MRSVNIMYTCTYLYVIHLSRYYCEIYTYILILMWRRCVKKKCVCVCVYLIEKKKIMQNVASSSLARNLPRCNEHHHT
jgi:hypothetical protein